MGRIYVCQIIILSFCRLVNESLQMLARYPELNTKILPLMEDYLVALRSAIAVINIIVIATFIVVTKQEDALSSSDLYR